MRPCERSPSGILAIEVRASEARSAGGRCCGQVDTDMRPRERSPSGILAIEVRASEGRSAGEGAPAGRHRHATARAVAFRDSRDRGSRERSSICGGNALSYDRRADGPPRNPHPGRRDRPRAHRGGTSRSRGDGSRLRLGRARGWRRRDGEGGDAAARRDAGVGAAEPRRPQGADHDADRHRVPLRQRRPPPRARAVRVPASLQDVPGCPNPLRGCRHRRRPREHRGPVRGHRVRGRERRRGEGHRRPQRAPGEADRAPAPGSP